MVQWPKLATLGLLASHEKIDVQKSRKLEKPISLNRPFIEKNGPFAKNLLYKTYRCAYVLPYAKISWELSLSLLDGSLRSLLP